MIASSFYAFLKFGKASVMDYLAIWQPKNAERISYSEKRVDIFASYIFQKERSKRSMKDLVHIRKTDISVKEHKGQLVASFRNIDTVYMIDDRPDRTAKRSFKQTKRILSLFTSLLSTMTE